MCCGAHYCAGGPLKRISTSFRKRAIQERFQAGAEEPCSDEDGGGSVRFGAPGSGKWEPWQALLGHMAIAALGLMVDCPTRRLVPKAVRNLPGRLCGLVHPGVLS